MTFLLFSYEKAVLHIICFFSYTPFRNVADSETPVRPLTKSSKQIDTNSPGVNPPGHSTGSALRRQHAEAQRLLDDVVRPVDVNEALLSE